MKVFLYKMVIPDSKLLPVIKNYMISNCGQYTGLTLKDVRVDDIRADIPSVSALQEVSCVLNSYTNQQTDIHSLPLLSKHFWTVSVQINPRVFVLSISIGDDHIKSVLKLQEYSRHTDAPVNELGIGLMINLFIGTYPCFVYTYAGFACSLPYEERPCSYLGNPEINGNYVLTQHIPGDDLYKFASQFPLTDRVRKCWKYVCYLMYMVDHFNKLTKFSHNDLHFGNVIMKPLSKSTTFEIPGTGMFIDLDFLPTIIDYGRSNFGIYGPIDSYFSLRPGKNSLLDLTYIACSWYAVLGQPDDFPYSEHISTDQLYSYDGLFTGDVNPSMLIQAMINKYGYPFTYQSRERNIQVYHQPEDYETQYFKDRVQLNNLLYRLSVAINTDADNYSQNIDHVLATFRPLKSTIHRIQREYSSLLTDEESQVVDRAVSYMNARQETVDRLSTKSEAPRKKSFYRSIF